MNTDEFEIIQSRVGYFPQFLPGELAYGTFTRFAKRSGSLTAQVVSQKLFGKPYIRLLVDYPTRLSRLCYVLPPGRSTTPFTIIDGDHTFFNIHRAFLPTERLEQLRQGMIQDRPQGLNIRTGELSQGIISKTTFFACCDCAMQDKKKFGTPLWRTIHQLHGVFVCPEHQIPLHNTGISTSDLRTYICLTTDMLNHATTDLYRQEKADTLLKIAHNLNWLLKNYNLTYNAADLRKRYIRALRRHDLATGNGSVRIQQLEEKFRTFYNPYFLEQLGCELDGKHKRNWLSRIAQTGQVQHPLRHALVFTSLDISAEEFFDTPLQSQPFGKSPWICLNSICQHYHKPVIEKVYLGYSRKSKRNPLGTFRCTVCGFTYSRVGPDISESDRLRGKTIEYGDVWDTKLIELWHSDKLRKDIAQILGVGYDTLMRQAKRLRLVELNTSEIQAPAILSDLPDAKRRWLKILKDQPETSMTSLMRQYSRIYWTLARFDSQFLIENQPKRGLLQEEYHAQVDWHARDIHFVMLVQSTVDCILADQNPLRRVTKNAIGIKLGFRDGSFSRDLRQMPQTHAEVGKYTETHEQFAVRRINKVKQQLISENQAVSRSEFIKLAGLSKSVQTHKVMNYIEIALSSIMSGS